LGNQLPENQFQLFVFYAALSIFLIAALIAAALLWIGVRSSITAIGRNPLSRHLVMAGLGTGCGNGGGGFYNRAFWDIFITEDIG